MHYNTIEEAEKDYSRKLETDFTHVLRREVRHPAAAELRERLVRFLRNNKIGTLATCSGNIPRATPVRYQSSDVDVYILTEGGGKIFNIQENPAVCFSVHGHYAGFTTCRCVQIWGEAALLHPGQGDGYDRALAIMGLTKRADLEQVNLEAVQAAMCIIRIEPRRARLLSLPVGILNDELSFT